MSKATFLEKFTAKYIPEPNSGCWLWTASTYPNGYGRMRMPDGITVKVATHVAILLFRDELVPVGYYVCHKCDNSYCVNPDHLFLGTAADNTRDCINKGRHKPPPRAKRGQGIKPSCKYGHKMEGDNLYTYPTGERACRECIRDRVRKQRIRKRSLGLTVRGTIPVVRNATS